jgi:hypothetical protein
MAVKFTKIAKYIIFILLQFCFVVGYAQFPKDSLEISLLTLTPGPEIYELYGHSSIRVKNYTRDIDIIYNYGVFDFDTPNFTLKFINGKLQYQLAKASFERFLQSYLETGQTMFEQKFNFTDEEKWNLSKNLEINYLPENRYYRYDFFHDNCATRIRDIVAKSIDGKIVYDSTYIKKPESFRDLIIKYQKVEPWVDFGTHILIGSDADSIATISDYLFLPEQTMKIYSKTKIITNGTSRALVQPPVEILSGTFKPESPTPLTSPLVIISALFIVVLIISFLGYKNQIHKIALDVFILFSTGIVGLLILLVWVGSAHEVLSRNYNIIWANPLSLVFAIFLLFKSQPKWYAKASLIYAFLLILFIGISFFLPQQIPAAAYPIIGITALRLIAIGLFYRTQMIKPQKT